MKKTACRASCILQSAGSAPSFASRAPGRSARVVPLVDAEDHDLSGHSPAAFARSLPAEYRFVQLQRSRHRQSLFEACDVNEFAENPLRPLNGGQRQDPFVREPAAVSRQTKAEHARQVLQVRLRRPEVVRGRPEHFPARSASPLAGHQLSCLSETAVRTAYPGHALNT